jgi:hypothetical protein
MDFAGTPEEKKITLGDKGDYKNWVPAMPKPRPIGDSAGPVVLPVSNTDFGKK